MVDEETGEEYIEERPKLAIPEVSFRTMNLRDEKVERDFITQLAEHGFPVSLRSQAVNIPIDFKEELEQRTEEKILTTMAEQEFKVQLFERLKSKQWPVPVELQEEYRAWLSGDLDGSKALQAQKADEAESKKQDSQQPGQPGQAKEGDDKGQDNSGKSSLAVPDLSAPTPTPNIAPTDQTSVPGISGKGDGDSSSESKDDKDDSSKPKSTPDESQEQRKNMPRKAGHLAEYDIDEMDQWDSTLNPKIAAALLEAANERPSRVRYGNREKFSTPREMRARKKMKLPAGTRVAKEDEYEQYVGPSPENWQQSMNFKDEDSA